MRKKRYKGAVHVRSQVDLQAFLDATQHPKQSKATRSTAQRPTAPLLVSSSSSPISRSITNNLPWWLLGTDARGFATEHDHTYNLADGPLCLTRRRHAGHCRRLGTSTSPRTRGRRLGKTHAVRGRGYSASPARNARLVRMWSPVSLFAGGLGGRSVDDSLWM